MSMLGFYLKNKCFCANYTEEQICKSKVNYVRLKDKMLYCGHSFTMFFHLDSNSHG